MVTIDTPNLPTDVPAVLGYALNIFLYGILVVQSFIYFTRFTKDSKWLRLFRYSTQVLLIFALETLAFAVVLYEMVQGANVHCLTCLSLAYVSSWDISWSFRTLSVLTGLIEMFAHGYYSWRIYVLSGYWYIPVFVMLSSFVQGIVLGIGMVFPNLIPNPTVLSDIWGIPTIICDSVITIETTRLLLRRKKQMAIAETNSLIRKLIQLTIETGAVTPAAMSLRFLLYNYDKSTDVVVSMSKQEIIMTQWPYGISLAQLIISYVMTRLYANCLLASLNARLVISVDNTRLEAVSTVLFDRSELRTKEEEPSVEIRDGKFHGESSGSGMDLDDLFSLQGTRDYPLFGTH
ncbi:hypothetical protein OG21DRAFT_1486675 [Imleria badia]|nr:hypothetical protein OG21DRAFT_1486675 [Imleria badia]